MPSYPAPGTEDWDDDLQAYIDGQDAVTLASAATYTDNAVDAVQADVDTKVETINGEAATAGAITISASDVGAAATSHTHDWTNDLTGKPAVIASGATQALARTAIAAADDAAVVKLTGNQTVAGTKTFSSAPSVPDASFSIAKTSGLQTALDAKMADGYAGLPAGSTVHRAWSGSGTPSRGTSRTDIRVVWDSPTAPPIVSSPSTAGAYDTLTLNGVTVDGDDWNLVV